MTKKFNNTSGVAQESIKEVSQDLSNKVSNSNTNLKLPKLVVLVAVAIGILLLVVALKVLFKSKKIDYSVNNSVPTKTLQKESPSSSDLDNTQIEKDLESLFSNIENIYGGNIPWNNINSREAYQFYPNEIKGFPLANKGISVNVDNDYNPIAAMTISDSVTAPIKNTFIGYYEIPKLMSEKYNLDDFDIVFPIELKLYELDRKLADSELSLLKSPDFMNCFNDKAEIQKASHIDEVSILQVCNLNPTTEQRSSLPNLFDYIYMIYFSDRNLVFTVGFNTQYIDNPKKYIDDYLAKLFGSNNNLFINSSQIMSAAKLREFEEWRRETFNNK
jgi:hypothetical protein